MFSLYKDTKSQTPDKLSIENYVNSIKYGTWQDFVIEGRRVKGKDEKKYKFIKSQAPAILGSCVMKPGNKVLDNIEAMNGFAVMDIDREEPLTEQQFYAIKEDKYTSIMHKSFGGIGYAVFVKIDLNKDYNLIYESLCEYYYKTFNIYVDTSCRNVNRLRYVSFDPDIYHNEKSATFRTVKKRKEPKKQQVSYIFTQSDFDNILSQIKARGIDLCREDYYRYTQIGMSLANEFGSSGADAFHFVCSMGSKYNRDHAERDYKGFCKRSSGKSSIGTFYYMCKEEGIDIYTPKTKKIIDRVKVAKTQGKPTVNSIVDNLKVANDIQANDEDKDLIKRLIESKEDFSKNANSDLTEIEQLYNFIKDAYNPTIDVITNITYINDENRLTDKEINDIYISCKKNFDFNVSKSDVVSLIESSLRTEIDNVKTFLHNNKSEPTGVIDDYISCIQPNNEYNNWAFKKWLVGAVHNWTCQYNDKLVCPLTLVLTGRQHGTGKTSFLRNIMPDELSKYITESKINGNDKDSLYTLANSLMVMDDEFGGKAFKDVQAYKSISDANIITQRRPYARTVEAFKRRAILCGTTNETDILKDVTGNRRILPITVESTEYDRMLKIDKAALIIEAYNLLRSGFDWMVRTQEDISYLKENTHHNETVLPAEEMFFKYFSIEPDDYFTQNVVYNQGEMLDYLLRRVKMQITKYDIKEVLTKNKIDYKTYKVGGKSKKGVNLYVKPFQEQDEHEVPF